MERNAGRWQVKVSKLMARKAFRMGFEDKRKGVWRGDDLAVLDHKGSFWTYERGRLFAACFPDAPWRAIKVGNSVTRQAVVAYLRLQKERVII